MKPPWINLCSRRRWARSRIGIRLRVPSSSGRPPPTRHAVHLLGRNQEFPIAKAKSDFGFSPGISLDEGISRSVAWLKSATK